MTTLNLNIRIDDDLKHQAKAILDGYGISPSQAVKMLFMELVATRKFPLSLSYQPTMSQKILHHKPLTSLKVVSIPKAHHRR